MLFTQNLSHSVKSYNQKQNKLSEKEKRLEAKRRQLERRHTCAMMAIEGAAAAGAGPHLIPNSPSGPQLDQPSEIEHSCSS